MRIGNVYWGNGMNSLVGEIYEARAQNVIVSEDL